MTVVTVTIMKSGNLVYEPNNKVRRGQPVRFVLDQINGPLWAKVNPPACLVATNPVTLDRTSAAPPIYEDPVSESAAFMTYGFTVEVPPVPEKPHLGGEAETKNGNLDVTTDPPEL
ncbi:hypothetical protein MXAN_5047 [Myxococcus xanthus DK 1622]|uniref:Uncharacterized protein n=1 Tax=Myxococcus xanthus (strain DK1622) TaxID=246197 RepID=Q1D2C1_MYXXD|nr:MULTISPECIES: hypothetical protein [Myxococcus]ABF92224.1 hypothetical protein MXAN_5047 [Myxococcus xanthus DK 1622]NOJ56685.1 hypothetical protein [Myxococcus xanthus]QPM77560.1 hypothetical protein I5Q59_24955 [Myxococcus xanthus]QVW66626.1 hypothetical protein JTM82_30305 [Myxococcus xanthus DZ2]QZZ52711.1 hypothetical protein MyxoNM_26220 [Myxococcus xanthus]